jgi:methylated-DNA-protein-cysteine methyltransferase-like protein
LKKRNLKSKVEAIVSKIPKGRVMTYGQLAALAGTPNAARVVGGIAHFGDSKLPWHRVVNKKGGLASGYPGGKKAHAQHLIAEGVIVDKKDSEYKVDIEKLIWWPLQSETVKIRDNS